MHTMNSAIFGKFSKILTYGPIKKFNPTWNVTESTTVSVIIVHFL